MIIELMMFQAPSNILCFMCLSYSLKLHLGSCLDTLPILYLQKRHKVFPYRYF